MRENTCGKSTLKLNLSARLITLFKYFGCGLFIEFEKTFNILKSITGLYWGMFKACETRVTLAPKIQAYDEERKLKQNTF